MLTSTLRNTKNHIMNDLEENEIVINTIYNLRRMVKSSDLTEQQKFDNLKQLGQVIQYLTQLVVEKNNVPHAEVLEISDAP